MKNISCLQHKTVYSIILEQSKSLSYKQLNYEIDTKYKIGSIPIRSIGLLCCCIEKKRSSQTSAELKHVLSTRLKRKTHLFNMPPNLTAIKETWKVYKCLLEKRNYSCKISKVILQFLIWFCHSRLISQICKKKLFSSFLLNFIDHLTKNRI